jgi:regulator of protease activity HflC (stomatin/prohibitin superfamily)
MLVVAIVIAVFSMIVIAKTIIVVPPDGAYVVERLGQYHQTFRSGMNVLAPFLDRVAFRYTLRPQDTQLTDRSITLDNIPISITSGIRWQITDPRAAAYNSANVNEFVVELVRSRQRQWIAEHSWNDVREGTRELQSALMRAVAESGAQGGVSILDVSISGVTRVAD